jgi:protein O-mannosyl-transferase
LTEESKEPSAPSNGVSGTEPSAEAALDARLSQGVLKGDTGIETAQVWMAGFLLFIAGLLAYSNAIPVPFHHKDELLLLESNALHRVTTVHDALGAPRQGLVSLLSLAVNWRLTPRAPAAFHGVNILLHLVNGVLLFLVLRRVMRPPVREPVAMAGALLFVLHPANTETVNYVVNRAVLLALCFSLLSVLWYLRAVHRGGFRPWMGLAALLAYAFALASSPIAWSTPLLILAASRIVGRPGLDEPDALGNGPAETGGQPREAAARFRWPLYAGFWLILAVWGVARWAGAGDTGPGLAWWQAWMERAEHLPAYLKLTFTARGLSVYHGPGQSAGLIGVGLTAGLLFGGAVLAFRRSLLGLAAFWYAGSLVLTAWPNGSAGLEDSALYFPLAGAAAAVPWLLDAVRRWQPAVVALGFTVAGLALLSGIAVFNRNVLWQDEIALWQDAALKAPESAEPPRQLGRAMLRTGQILLAEDDGEARDTAAAPGRLSPRQREERAMQHFLDAENYLSGALELAPDRADRPEILLELGLALGNQNKQAEAIEQLEQAVWLEPENHRVAVALAGLWLDKWSGAEEPEDLTTAVEYLDRAWRLGGLPDDLTMGYASALYSLGDYQGSIGVLQSMNHVEGPPRP